MSSSTRPNGLDDRRPRARFLGALGAFAAWVLFLIVLAVATGRRPPLKHPAERPAPNAKAPRP